MSLKRSSFVKLKKQKIGRIYNINFFDCQNLFKQYTSKTTFLTKIFEDEDNDLEMMTEKFLKKLQGCISHNFKKRN